MVGSAKPPERTRFKKGHSGNPAGRPKGKLSLASIVERVLFEKVSINKNGRRKMVTKLEKGISEAVNKMLAGDLRAFDRVTNLLPLRRWTANTESEYVPSKTFHIPPVNGTFRADGKTLIEVVREIYGLNNIPDAPAGTRIVPDQKRWVADRARLKMATKARRVGFSFAAGFRLVIDCLEYRPQTCAPAAFGQGPQGPISVVKYTQDTLVTVSGHPQRVQRGNCCNERYHAL